MTVSCAHHELSGSKFGQQCHMLDVVTTIEHMILTAE